MNWIVVAAAVPGLCVSIVLSALMRRWARRWRLVDTPGGHKAHATPTPYGGGVAIWAGVVLPLAIGQLTLVLWARAEHLEGPSAGLDLSRFGVWAERLAEFVGPHLSGLIAEGPDLWFFLAAGSVLMILGLADDLRKLDWRFRLAIETVVAAAVVFGRGWKLTLFIDWPLLTSFISVAWIVGLVNAFNMLDNMDGLSAGVAAIAATFLAVVLMLVPNPTSGNPQLFVAGFLFLLVGSLLGFLFHNRPPARIFMGDAGSYFVGFSVAVMTILATFSGNGLPRHAILAPLCVLAVPLYDMVSVICIRASAGQSPFQGDQNHFSHRLVDLGLTKGQAVLTIYLTTMACGLGALVLHQVNSAGAVVIALMIGCLLGVIAILETTARRKMRP